MVRPIRVEFTDAVYHIMARGNERREIFSDDQDRRAFLRILAEMARDYHVLVHAYCLMPNHYHLIAQTPLANLSQAVGWLQVSYAVRYNKRHKRYGHLFQGRFKAHLIDPESFGPALVRYVHVNPVRPKDKRLFISAERFKELDNYEWSSHRDYAGVRKSPNWLCLKWLRLWKTREAYRAFIRELSDKPVATPWSDLRGGLVLGTESLWKRVKNLALEKGGQQEKQWEQNENRKDRRKKLAPLISDEEDIRVRIWARVRLGGERKINVAHDLGYSDGSAVTHILRRLEIVSQNDTALSKKMNYLKSQMSSFKS